MIRVCLAGVTGWVGQSLLAAVLEARDLELAGAVSRSAAGKSVAELLPGATAVAGRSSLVVRGSVREALESRCDVLVDYTSPAIVKDNVLRAIRNRVHVVIGTSGLTNDDYDEIARAARAHEVGVIAGANFAISAILLEQLAAVAARYLPSWEVIDYAKADKPDAPSGTARQLAHRLAGVRAPAVAVAIGETHEESAARGLTLDGTQVHSIRLPGQVIGAEVVFGGPEERLSIRYDGGSGAGPYVAGTLLAIRRVGFETGLRRSLELAGAS